MSQAALTGTTDETEDEDPYQFVEYLDVPSMKLVNALAATLHTESEVEKFIEAEKQRWNRDAVLRILRRRKQQLV